MSKSIVFVDDCSDICSKPQFAAVEGNEALFLSEDNALVLRSPANAACHASLVPVIDFSEGERAVTAAKVAPRTYLVALTSTASS